MASAQIMRFERKYLLDEDTAFLLKQRISYVLKPDKAGKNGMYKVSSLYLDDQYNTAFYDKQNGLLTRDKLRLRYYNNSFDNIRLECKYKHGEMVWKEQVPITSVQYDMICQRNFSFVSDIINTYKKPNCSDKEYINSSVCTSDALLERIYAIHMARQLRPVVVVEYNRHAFCYEFGDTRITFDSNLTTSKPMENTASTRQTYNVLPEKNVILEIKYTNFIPLIVTGLLSGFQLSQQLSISKYVMARMTLQGR